MGVKRRLGYQFITVQQDVLMAKKAPAYDLIVFGATSFVGQILTRYLVTQYGNDADLRWALAGRSIGKLEALRDELGSAASGLPLIVADAGDAGAMRQLCGQHPGLKVVVVSASENPAHMRKAIDTGAQGFIPKSFCSDRLIAALEVILEGRVFLPDAMTQVNPAAMAANGEVAPGTSREQLLACLTPRQLEILHLLAQGQSNKQIARHCQLSENTIKVHVSAILRALALSNRTQAGVLMQKLNDRPATA